jgi:hypothetical protein
MPCPRQRQGAQSRWLPAVKRPCMILVVQPASLDSSNLCPRWIQQSQRCNPDLTSAFARRKLHSSNDTASTLIYRWLMCLECSCATATPAQKRSVLYHHQPFILCYTLPSAAKGLCLACNSALFVAIRAAEACQVGVSGLLKVLCWMAVHDNMASQGSLAGCH